MILKKFSAVALFLFIYSCGNPAGPDNIEHQDKLIYKSTDGVISYFDFEKTTYSLDEDVRADLLTVNQSDTHKIHIKTTGGPLSRFEVFNDDGERIFTPMYITGTAYDFYFSPGDSFTSKIDWRQICYTNNKFAYLRTYSGWYRITASQPGLHSGKVWKWIRITEEGDPLSTKLYWYFADDDSVKLDFLIRNRIQKHLTYDIVPNRNSTLTFYDNTTDSLVLEFNLDIPVNHIDLPAKSEASIFRYRESKEKLINAGVEGSFECNIKIPCVSKTLEAKGLVVVH